MIRATTQSIRIRLPFIDRVDILQLTFSQRGNIILEKGKNDFSWEDELGTLQLTQDETKMFSTGNASVQVRLLFNDGTAPASRIVYIDVSDVLHDNTLGEDDEQTY